MGVTQGSHMHHLGPPHATPSNQTTGQETDCTRPQTGGESVQKIPINMPSLGSSPVLKILHMALQPHSISLAQIFSSVQSLSALLFATPRTVACQASLSITKSQSLLKLISIESVMPSNHLVLGRPLLLPPSIFPSVRVFSSELVLHIRWP